MLVARTSVWTNLGRNRTMNTMPASAVRAAATTSGLFELAGAPFGLIA